MGMDVADLVLVRAETAVSAASTTDAGANTNTNTNTQSEVFRLSPDAQDKRSAFDPGRGQSGETSGGRAGDGAETNDEPRDAQTGEPASVVDRRDLYI